MPVPYAIAIEGGLGRSAPSPNSQEEIQLAASAKGICVRGMSILRPYWSRSGECVHTWTRYVKDKKEIVNITQHVATGTSRSKSFCGSWGGKDFVSQPIIRVLVVDDEPAIRRALSLSLLELGFLVAEASRGEDALKLLRAGPFDAVLLDMRMPGIGGIETLRRIRSFAPRLPILMLTVCDQEVEKVKAFDLGADDYIVKPFSIPELIARIRATVRRVGVNAENEPIENETIEIGIIRMEPAKRSVTKRGHPVHLTPKEFDILHYLMSRVGQVVTHQKLLTAVWGENRAEEIEYLRTYVRQLRMKIEDDRSNPRYLLTEAHIGYRFADASELSSNMMSPRSRR